ncbi:polymeric immunoglobulin receptor-like [Pristis pectinata]|uniref:polymeric immunoglobulin receptor-like n=1 Tax=Pristis pectinata TaxID=685728 RepID=UPI00223D3C01|nr:polymeric immunoglobulin receptor-like [Pristis pectinata]
MMWILILFICYLPVSGALWAERDVRGVVGRAITINCHYTHWYRSHTKYWCDGWTRRCSTIVATTEQHGRRGRASITDNPAGGIFTVTVEDLHPGDAGLYSCGISTFGLDPMFPVHLQVSDEPVSVPVIGFLSPTNVSRLGGSVSVSCESVQGSLPIQYTWYEKTQSVDSKVSDTSKLDLHCQSFKHQHHQYYCTASNNGGAKSSDFVTVNVMVFNSTGSCSFVTETNNTVSGALLAKDEVRGVVGRAITIDCHYAAIYRSHTKYWCRVWDRHCSALMKTNEQRRPSGRRSITDNPGRGIFTVTVEDLRSEDTGMYKCGITTLDKDPTFNVHLQISDEPVSVPVLGFLSPANVSSPECSVSVSCESVQGSFPIDYAWYEKTPSADLKISDTNKLDLHCQSFKHRHHQYYCTASNKHGNKSSEMIKLSTSNSDDTCIIVKEVNNTVSGALWGKKNVSGVLGRAITIGCHYEAKYRSHTKYWCHGWSRQCSVLLETNRQHGRRGRASITDNPARGIFTVTLEDLHSGDTGWYSCGIAKPGEDSMFNVHLQVSDEPVSVPVIGFLSPANVSRLGGSVSVSCESVQGSLPIQYTWYEKTPSVDPKVSDTSKLDLHCQSFKHPNHQYYCTASNNYGKKSSEMINMTVFKNYMMRFSRTAGLIPCCGDCSITTLQRMGSIYLLEL